MTAANSGGPTVHCKPASHGLMIRPAMKVLVTNPHQELEVPGPTRVQQLLKRLDLTPEAYLVIRGNELVTEDTVLEDSDSIEIRSVISGG